MDLWIVAAATGAGYVAKHWKNLSKEKDDSLEYSFSVDDKKFKNLIRQVRDRTEPYVLEDGRFSGHRWFDVCTREVTASSSGSQSVMQMQPVCDESSYCRIYNELHGGISMMHEKESSSFNVFNRNRHHRKMSRQPWSPLESCHAEYSSRLPKLQGKLSGMLFILGMTIGIISGIVTYREEIDRLNDVVSQTQNLVHDLHEQLEMKEQRMNVEEISTNENFLRNRESVMSCADNWDPEESDNIEAELEVELQRLELNFQITDFVELDSDFEIDIIQGDVKLDGAEDFSDSNEVTGTIETPDDQIPSPNYAVSPQELALCLHQVLQEQLEARIWELEAALEATQKKLDSA